MQYNLEYNWNFVGTKIVDFLSCTIRLNKYYKYNETNGNFIFK